MIEIIKHGTPKKYQAICDDCGAVLEFVKRDVIRDPIINGGDRGIICPECGNWISFSLLSKI